MIMNAEAVKNTRAVTVIMMIGILMHASVKDATVRIHILHHGSTGNTAVRPGIYDRVNCVLSVMMKLTTGRIGVAGTAQVQHITYAAGFVPFAAARPIRRGHTHMTPGY